MCCLFTQTALLCATHNNSPELMRLLLDYKASVDQRDDLGATPLIHAAQVIRWICWTRPEQKMRVLRSHSFPSVRFRRCNFAQRFACSRFRLGLS